MKLIYIVENRFRLHHVILERIDWRIVLFLFQKIYVSLKPSIQVPFLLPHKNKDDKPVAWDYKNRNWYYWSHLLASQYGWSISDIENLKVDDGLAYIQECLVQQQLDREFTWSMSEMAYPYDAVTKKSIFKPLERPYYMLEPAKPIRKVRMLKAYMPVGVIRNQGMMDKYAI